MLNSEFQNCSTSPAPTAEEAIIDKAMVILESRLIKPESHFVNSKDVRNYLKLRFRGLEYESFRVMFLNNQHGMISLKEMFRGTINGAAVYPREILKVALEFNAAAVIIAHNHPSGEVEPSSSDKHITNKIGSALSLIDVNLLDHIIVGGSETYSFAENSLI